MSTSSQPKPPAGIRSVDHPDLRPEFLNQVEETTMTARFSARRRDVITLLGGAAALLVPGVACAQRPEAVGSVTEVEGEAFAEARAERRTLQRASACFINDVVATSRNSRLTLRLGRDTTLRLGQEARLTIDRYLVDAGGEITLQSGPILYDRPAHATPSRLSIQSPFALISVRGTRFFAGPSAGTFGVFVERGSVVVSAAGSRVLLRPGQGTNVAYPGAAPTPAAPWGAERIRSAMARV